MIKLLVGAVSTLTMSVGKLMRNGHPMLRIKGMFVVILHTFACIWDEIKKKVDDAQNGDFGPLFVAVGLVGAFATLVIIIIVGGRNQ